MKNLGGRFCDRHLCVTNLIFFILLVPCIGFLLTQGDVSAKEIDCTQFQKLLGISFAMHRIAFKPKDVYSIYLSSVADTIRELDPKEEALSPAEGAKIINGINGESFSKCEEAAKIEAALPGRFPGGKGSANIHEMILKKFLPKMDPHSNFFNTNEWKKFKRRIEGKFEGIGITYSVKNAELVVLSVIKGSPSQNVLVPGDIILEIGGNSTKGLKQEEVSKLISSIPGTITLSVRRGDELLVFDIEKKEFKVPSTESRFLDDYDGVLYVSLSEFSRDSSKELEEAIETASLSSEVRGIILDLRYNPGGYVDEASKIASYFLRERFFALEVFRDREEKVKLEASYRMDLSNIPLIVMINNFSASASELLAIAIKDYQRGIIVGTSSFGKGTGQSVFSPEELSIRLEEDFETAMALTTFQFYSPMGNTPQRNGVVPHISVKDPELEKRILKSIQEASLKNENIYIRESDYPNALSPSPIASRVLPQDMPTNNIQKIVSAVDGMVSMPKGEFPVDLLDKDPQLYRSCNLMHNYIEQCKDYRISSCEFPEGPYASR